MRLRRRALLASLGSAVVSAGCLGAPGAPQNGDGGGTGPSDTPTATPGGPTGTATQTRPPGRFADEPCPSFTETDRTVCWHTRADSDVFLEPSAAVFRPVANDGTVETITFTLHNDSDGTFELNPYAWAVKRKDDGEWRHVAPDAYVEPLIPVLPGETFEWVLSRQPHPTPETDRRLYPTAEVGAGRHAFAVDGLLGEESAADQERVECVALFDVVLTAEN
jgi:hypothetical protein